MPKPQQTRVVRRDGGQHFADWWRMKFYDNVMQNFARSRIGGWMFVNVFNAVDRVLMGATKARINTGFGTKFQENAVLLGCTGARSGRKREIPLRSTPVGSEY